MRPVPFEDLTTEQQQFARLPTTRHVAAIGAPGSGKTLVLLHRALQLIERGTAPERVLIVTYTNALEDYIAAGLHEFGLPRSMVISFDDLVRRQHRRITGRARQRRDKPAGRDRYERLRDEVHSLVSHEASSGLFDFEPPWDAVLVDEAQDLSATDISTLALLGRHVTVVLDGRQRLYERGGSTSDLLGALGLRYETTTLLSTFRCSENVIKIASSLAVDPEDRAALPAGVARRGAEITSLRVVAQSREEEEEHLKAALRARLDAHQTCAVLLPERRWAFGLAKALRNEFFVEDQSSLDLTSGAVKVLTYHSAKGLSFDSVFLPRLYEANYSSVARLGSRESLLFVALTRATSYLFLSTVAGLEVKEWSTLESVSTAHLAPPDPVGATSMRRVAAPLVKEADFLEDYL
ncbi:UvrD-helicase domain-containing protein [Ornithinimicrobium kibberense]|uniref:DNA 3'-5' helicase n=1 Tax=Ornithinimicrobium kibberense TaxID=282060 RepID=A0ABV5V3R9_9MICO|nr:UvrD-helicase domain-containing protein [Ornithinimicrobium kibberense]